MKLYEFQAKNILRGYGIHVPQGRAISRKEDAANAYAEIGAGRSVIKAQIFAGGRGKSGGILFADSPVEAESRVAGMLGARIVTPQTAPQGAVIQYVLLEEAISITRELYLAIVIDRSFQTPMVVACGEGGVEIEEAAAKHPEKIIKEPIDVLFGIHPFQVRRLAARLPLSGVSIAKVNSFLTNLFSAFVQNDCSLLEINPLVITADGELCALDVKMDIDDNALYRHPEFEPYVTCQDATPAEALARKHKLSYIGLDGNIGCLVNGAGLAMATMDIIKLHGGEPANFLDVGGDASLEQVTQAFRIILSDPKVKSVLINIFGGIMKCDTIASGIIEAIKGGGVKTPLIVRLEGTNADVAGKTLEHAGSGIFSVKDMEEAARLAVSKARESN
ncbi:MAG: ADP-forming succinate--CoA ligase subunit beta [Planctomycetota bacterium]